MPVLVKVRLDISFAVEGDLSSFGPAGTELLRALQEALTNVRRHAEAEGVLLKLTGRDDYLLAEVSDDGRGFGPELAPNVGFRSMRERLAALSGELDVQSEPGEGTRVRFRVPMSTLLGNEHTETTNVTERERR